MLDEADRMLDMGFKPAVDRIVRGIRSSRQTLLFSATLDPAVERLARTYTVDTIRHDEAPERRADVEHRFVPIGATDKLDALVHELRHLDRGRTLVFVRTKRGADRLVKRLRPHGVQAAAMHGDKTQGQRERALRSFADGRTDLLIATDVAARGLDVDGITHVINFDAPTLREDYVHRVGRTGRAGASGVGITFVAADQANDVAKIASELGLDAELPGAALAVARNTTAGGGRNRSHQRSSGSSRLSASASTRAALRARRRSRARARRAAE